MKKKTRSTRQAKWLRWLSRHRVWLFVGLFAVIGGFFVYASYAAVPVHYSIIVVAGQSNADGAEAYITDPTTGVNIFSTKHAADSATKLVWSNLAKNSGPPPVALNSINTSAGQYTNGQATFGPEVGLARGLYDQGRRNLLVLKVSYGGLSLGIKDGQDWNTRSSNEAYWMLVQRMNATKAWIASQGGTASVDGFYWVQGESDTVPTLAPQYESNLRELVAKSRSDLGMSSQAPFVIAKTSMAAWIKTAQNLLGNCGSTPCDQMTQADITVRAAQQKVADTVPNTKIVDTLPLPRRGLNIHLSNVGELQLGALFAQASAGTPVPAAATAAGTAAAAKSGSTKTATPSSTTTVPTASSTAPTSTTSTTAQAANEAAAAKAKTSKKSLSWWQRVRSYLDQRLQGIKRYLSS